jgi:hypothetical protein
VIAEVNAFTAAITTEKAARSTEISAFSDEEVEITTDKAEGRGD